MPVPTFAPSPKQKEIIAHGGGHIQVIACAGAGKTEAISRRVFSLIEEGVEPAQIVAFTFTERAAAGLKNRITRRIAESKGEAFLDRLSRMFVGTIHAYCLHMLQDHVPEFGNFDILEVEERRLLNVAMTRAKDLLHLSRFRKKTNKFQPSPFLLEVPENAGGQGSRQGGPKAGRHTHRGHWGRLLPGPPRSLKLPVVRHAGHLPARQV